MVERTDWTFEKPVSRHEQPLPGSAVVVVPAARDLTPGEMIQQYEAEGVHGFESEAPAGDPLEGMTEDQLETVQVAIGMILGEDPTGFAEAFDRLSPGLQGKVFTTLSANPHLRGLDLIDAIERKLTLAEAAEAEAFLRGLSPEHRRLLRG